MPIELPAPTAAFIAAVNAGDPAAAGKERAAAAVVRDDGQTHAGIAAITRWQAATTRACQPTMQPLTVAERDGNTVVTSRVTGMARGASR